MEKDADAYRTISEVAETLDIPPHVLRFWEGKFPQIKPLKRGGGRRYYRRSDTDLLGTIRRLLYEDGYTIRGVQRLLRSKGAATVAAQPAGGLPQSTDDALPTADGAGLDDGGDDREQARAPLIRLQAEIAACRAVLAEALGDSGRPSRARTQDEGRATAIGGQDQERRGALS